MKIEEIDFRFLDRLVAAGATAAVIVEVLKEAKQSEKRERERERLAAKRGNIDQQSPTGGNNEQQSPTEKPSETAERELFTVAKKAMGPRCGGLVASLVRHHNYDLAAARRVVDIAVTKQDPREYLVASMRTTNGKRTVQAAADDLIERVRALDAPVPGNLRDREGEDTVRGLSPL